MIKNIIHWSLQKRLFVLVSAAIILAWGGYETTRIPIDIFPDLSAPTVQIITEAHGMAPQEVENLITTPVESVLNGSSGIRRVRSSSAVGLSIIWAEFEWGTDIYKARQIVSEKLQQIRNTLPAHIPSPQMAPITSIMGEIMFIGLTSDKHDAMTLKTIADWNIRKRLLSVAGIAEVINYGGDTRQYQVHINPARLAAYNITLDQVIKALESTNENASAGFFSEGGMEYLIQGIGRVRTIDDIANTLVILKGNEPVLIRHIADVKIGAAPKRGTASVNGNTGVVLGLQKQPGQNTLELTKAIDLVLDDIEASLPEGMSIHRHLFRQANFIQVSVNNLVNALRDGAILVIIIVFAFLYSSRATAITLVALPISLLTAILCMSALNISINTMSLGGMAIALGALVDDAIIVVENIVRRLKQQGTQATLPESVISIVLDATREIQGSIVFATLIIMLVFVPLFFLSGVEGRLMQPLGLAYVISLAASLIVAITVTPVMAYMFLPQSKLVLEDREPSLTSWLKSAYSKSLNTFINKWKPISIASSIVLALALIVLLNTGKSFLPEFNEGSMTITANTVPGTDLKQTDKLAELVEKTLLKHKEIVATARRTGRAESDPHAQEVFASEIEVTLDLQGRAKDDFLDALRKDLSSIPGMNIILGQPISHRIDHILSGTRASIAIKIFGNDLYELRRIAKRIETLTKSVEGTADVQAEQQVDVPFLRVRFNRNRIARYGMRINDVAKAIETAFNGVTISRIIEGQNSFDLVARFNYKVKSDLDSISHTLITTPTGARVPLHGLAEIYKDTGPNRISHENVQRKMVVSANTANRAVGDVVDELRETIRTNIKLPTGYHIEYGGQFESAESASRTLLLVGLVVFAGVFILLYLAFSSSRDALLVMINLPLALIGGVAGVYMGDGIISIASIIGFITLFGIATRNGVMLVAHIHNLINHEGVIDPLQAVTRGARERLIPILMTALAAGLALIPLALSAGEPGSEIQAPMAMVILFGLLTSTLLNMYVVPALYLRFGSVIHKQ